MAPQWEGVVSLLKPSVHFSHKNQISFQPGVVLPKTSPRSNVHRSLFKEASWICSTLVCYMSQRLYTHPHVLCQNRGVGWVLGGQVSLASVCPPWEIPLTVSVIHSGRYLIWALSEFKWIWTVVFISYHPTLLYGEAFGNPLCPFCVPVFVKWSDCQLFFIQRPLQISAVQSLYFILSFFFLHATPWLLFSAEPSSYFVTCTNL